MKKLYSILMMGALVVLLSSCNLFGLELQRDAEYNYSPVQLTMDITAYEFIETRRNMDMFLLYKAIEKAGYREAFEMNRFQHLTYGEIASQLNVSSKTVDYRIQQALKLLRVDLRDYLPILLAII